MTKYNKGTCFLIGFIMLMLSMLNVVLLILSQRHMCCDGGSYYFIMILSAIGLFCLSILLITFGITSKEIEEKGRNKK